MFWVPPEARFERILAAASLPDVGERMDKALNAIESDNPEQLRGVLPRIYARAPIQPAKLGELAFRTTSFGQLLSRVVVRIWFGGRTDGGCAVCEEAVSRPMSLFATARSIPGTLRQEVVIDGQYCLMTDEPTHLGGEGSGPAPHELFPAALAACVSTTLVIYARTKSWELGEVTVEVDYDQHSTPRRFEVAIRLSGDLSDAQIERLEKVALACPLRRSIEAGIEFVERIERRSRPVGELVETGGGS